jgi:hypothetical protein
LLEHYPLSIVESVKGGPQRLDVSKSITRCEEYSSLVGANISAYFRDSRYITKRGDVWLCIPGNIERER